MILMSDEERLNKLISAVRDEQGTGHVADALEEIASQIKELRNELELLRSVLEEWLL